MVVTAEPILAKPASSSGGMRGDSTTDSHSDQPVAARGGLLRRVGRGIARVGRAMGSAAEWCFGVLSLIVGLAILATIPILQFLSLGYLLEVSGRIARTDSLASGFIGMRKAARIGTVALGVWLLFWPLRFVSSLWCDARLIGEDIRSTRVLHSVLVALSILLVGHAISACLRGGRLRDFLWPRPIHLVKLLARASTYSRARDSLWDFAAQLRLPYYFWLGVRGFVGALAWLIVPVTLLAGASRVRGGAAPLVGIVGGLLFAFVLMHLPFLQTRFAAENRLAAMFEIRENRLRFSRAPIAWLIALLFTLALAVPLYLLKIEIIPREAAWLPSLLFVVSIFPARFLTGWVFARAERHLRPRFRLSRWLARAGMLPIAASYALIVYFTQYLSWHGLWSLYEQHAFLVPVPFLGL